MNLLAKFLARPAVTAWLIRRAMRTPYSHIEKNGEIYMERYWLFNPYPANTDGRGRRWGDWLPSVRLHKIMREDRDRHLHDHPWDARTFILRGWYREHRKLNEYAHAILYRCAGDTATLRFGEYHAITDVPADGVWTMFVIYRYRGTWGFLVNGRKIPWREYLGIPK